MKAGELSAVIVSLRASRGWSQSELAKRAGLSRNCIALIEAESERANSTISTLQKIFAAFDLDIRIEFKPKRPIRQDAPKEKRDNRLRTKRH